MSNQYLQRWSDVVLLSAGEFWRAVALYLPNLIGAVVLLAVGLFAARFFRRLTARAMKISSLARVAKASKVNEVLKSIGLKTDFVEILASSVYWVVMAIFVLAISEVLGLRVVVDTLNRLIVYIPSVVAAVIVFILALAAAKIVRDMFAASLEQMGVAHGETIGRLAGGVLVLFGVLVAASQLGFDVAILSANVTLIVAGVVAAAALAFGLGLRSLVANLAAGYYTSRWFKKGQIVTLSGIRGTVKEVNSIVVILESEGGEVYIPNKEIIERGSR